jgi:hypothetical protein
MMIIMSRGAVCADKRQSCRKMMFLWRRNVETRAVPSDAGQANKRDPFLTAVYKYSCVNSSLVRLLQQCLYGRNSLGRSSSHTIIVKLYGNLLLLEVVATSPHG